jgi:hypothetical protein
MPGVLGPAVDYRPWWVKPAQESGSAIAGRSHCANSSGGIPSGGCRCGSSIHSCARRSTSTGAQLFVQEVVNQVH